MSRKKTKLSVSGKEPAERVVTVALSVAEVIWLANFHRREMKGVNRRMQQAVTGLYVGGAIPPLKTVQKLYSLSREQITAHSDRAGELLKLAKEHLKFNAGGEV
jgi:hypothetical protein